MTQWTELDDVLREAGSKWSHLKPAAKFKAMWDAYGYSRIAVEHIFRSDRGFRLDFSWPTLKVGVEIHGFGYGHQAQQNLAEDCEKMRFAIASGWIVIPFTTRCIASRSNCYDAVEFVCLQLERRAEEHDIRVLMQETR